MSIEAMNVPDISRLSGFDTLRILALVLITWQHIATSLGGYADTQWHGISPGQTGVAMFCVMAGYLACRQRPASVSFWFRRRLLVLFPAYWLVTLAAFAMVLVMPHKTVSLGLFVSQMLGLGYFTHGWELVNVVSWFLSLILLCYALTVVAWYLPKPSLVWSMVIALCLALLLARQEVALSRHVLAYALGALLALLPAWRSALTGCAVLLALLGALFDAQLFYAGGSMLLLLAALRGWLPGGEAAERLNRYSYAYFLVHGISLAVAFSFIGNVWLALVAAIVLACLAAVALEHMQASLAPLLARGLGIAPAVTRD